MKQLLLLMTMLFTFLSFYTYASEVTTDRNFHLDKSITQPVLVEMASTVDVEGNAIVVGKNIAVVDCKYTLGANYMVPVVLKHDDGVGNMKSPNAPNCVHASAYLLPVVKVHMYPSQLAYRTYW